MVALTGYIQNALPKFFSTLIYHSFLLLFFHMEPNTPKVYHMCKHGHWTKRSAIAGSQGSHTYHNFTFIQTQCGPERPNTGSKI